MEALGAQAASSSVPVAVLTMSGIATLGLSQLCRSASIVKGSGGKGVTTYQFLELCLLLYLAIGSASFWLADPRPLTERSGWLHFCFITTSYLCAERLILGILLEHADLLAVLPPRTHQLKLMYERGFTRVTIFWVLAACTNRRDLEDVYAAATVGAWSSLITFHAVLLLDSSAHRRLAAHVCSIPWPHLTPPRCTSRSCLHPLAAHYSTSLHPRALSPPFVAPQPASVYPAGLPACISASLALLYLGRDAARLLHRG